MPYTYMLRCADGSYYVGSTVNLDVRMAQHQAGMGAAYTRRRLPVELSWAEEHQRIDEAFRREKQIQNWSRGKREALIAGDERSLHLLARRRSKRPTLEVEPFETPGCTSRAPQEPP